MFSSNPSNFVGKIFLCGGSWPWPQLQLRNEWTPQDVKAYFLEKRPWKQLFYRYSNSRRSDSTPHIQSNVRWIKSKAELEISFMKTRVEKWVWESGPKIDPATGVGLFLAHKPTKTQIQIWKKTRTKTKRYIHTHLGTHSNTIKHAHVQSVSVQSVSTTC